MKVSVSSNTKHVIHAGACPPQAHLQRLLAVAGHHQRGRVQLLSLLQQQARDAVGAVRGNDEVHVSGDLAGGARHSTGTATWAEPAVVVFRHNEEQQPVTESLPAELQQYLECKQLADAWRMSIAEW